MMEKGYQVRCPRCGGKSEVKSSFGYGRYEEERVKGGYIETQMPIRCPHCLMRLNLSAEEFRGQMERKG